jgi:hypothetical protein
MGAVASLLGLPVGGPISALLWVARQVAEAATQQMLDPARIERALMALEHRLDIGDIDEAAFEREEALLLAELAEMRAMRAEGPSAAAHGPDHHSNEQQNDQSPAETAAGALAATHLGVPFWQRP